MFEGEVILFKCTLNRDYPPVDICESGGKIVFFFDIPGLNPERLTLKICDEYLVLEGTSPYEEKEKIIRYLCMERVNSSFRRIIRLPKEVSPEQAKAVYKKGVLKITIPKKDKKVYRIKIESTER